jgi:hypothetical protein
MGVKLGGELEMTPELLLTINSSSRYYPSRTNKKTPAFEIT